MKKESYEDQPDDAVPDQDHPQHIHSNGNFSMQRMKTYTAACWIKNWICQKVIKIHEHRGDKDKPVLLPVFFIVEISNSCRRNKMKEIMNKFL